MDGSGKQTYATTWTTYESYKINEGDIDTTKGSSYVYSNYKDEYPEDGPKVEVLENGQSVKFYYKLRNVV